NLLFRKSAALHRSIPQEQTLHKNGHIPGEHVSGNKNLILVGHLRRTDCSLVSDGAAAVVLASSDTARSMKQAVRFRSAVQVNDYLPMSKRDIIAFEGPRLASQKTLTQSDISLSDLSFVETHDCFTTAELIEYEGMGLTPPGRDAQAIEEGWTEMDGRLPVNPSDGLKAKGHPSAQPVYPCTPYAPCNFWLQHGGGQVPGAELAGLFNMGGAAVANFASILECLR
ncbi:thiolase C-terminal domain-containing protein, partial [Acidocella aromatica]|nr:hypothetical protein [Acidocella aromatica]